MFIESNFLHVSMEELTKLGIDIIYLLDSSGNEDVSRCLVERYNDEYGKNYNYIRLYRIDRDELIIEVSK